MLISPTCTSCGVCCKPTHMPLSLADLDEITAAGFDIDACTEPSREHRGLRVLKNVGGRCYFLREGKEFTCALYPRHPRGCKFYPLIYDAGTRRCILDKKYCPRWRSFVDEVKGSREHCDALVAYLTDGLHLI